MKTNHLKLSLIFACLAAILPPARAENEPDIDLVLRPGELEIKPSFETSSYYFRLQGSPGEKYSAEFRRAGEERWQPTLETVTNEPVGIWKGSIFGLQEDTAWQLRVLSDGKVVAQGDFRTWTSHPPVAKVVDLSKLAAESKDGCVVISDQGRPDGWIKFTAPKGWVLRQKYDVNDPHLAAITFKNAQYVLLENVTVEGGNRHAIMVDDSESVRILNCEISGWGRLGIQQFTNTDSRGKYADPKGDIINKDEGVQIYRSARTVVERCYIHDPRHRSNSWMFAHPSGPEGITADYARGGTVLRWNDLVGSDEHRWNDVIGSHANPSRAGGFYRDSDITGNFLAFGNDDGVELEGGGMNVRFYWNKIEGTTCGVSTGPCLLGPQYVIGNLLANLGDESGLSLMLFKNGHSKPQSGKRYFVNNTLYSLDCAAFGRYEKSVPGAHLSYMRNNVVVCNETRLPDQRGRLDDFDHDLFWANNNPQSSRRLLAGFQKVEQEAHGVIADPHLLAPEQGDFHLAADSVARRQAVAVPNITPAGVDLGAFYGGRDELPYRPLALLATPRQLNFSNPREQPATTVVLSLPASAKEPVKFQIRQNRVFTWFKVEPSAGELQPGETLKLSVSVDPAKLTGRPLFKGAFLVRTPEGLSRPVTVYAPGTFAEDLRPAEAPNTVYLPAAELPGLQKYAKTTDAPAVSGGKFVELGGKGVPSTLGANFTIAKTGRYALLARMSIGSHEKNHGFELTMDQSGKATNLMITDDYQWNIANKRFRVVFLHDLGQLEAGPHQLRFKAAKGESMLNELILTDNPEVFFAEYWQRERGE